MADPKPTQAKPVSPILDTNGDGILQGSELRAQLKAEEEAGSIRTKNEKVHGLLEVLGIRHHAENYAQDMLAAQLSTNPAQAIKAVQENGAADIKRLLEAAGVFMERPSSVAKLDKDLAALPKRDDIPPEQKEVVIADAKSFADFGKALKGTFPKGVQIAPEDATEIMAHFARIPVIVPMPEKKQNGANI